MISLYSRGPSKVYWHTVYRVSLYLKPYGDTVLLYVGLHVLDRHECELAYNHYLISLTTTIFVSLTIIVIIIVTLARFTWFIRPNSSNDPWKGYEMSDDILYVQTSLDYVNERASALRNPDYDRVVGHLTSAMVVSRRPRRCVVRKSDSCLF